MNPGLIVLAAGLSTRFGRLKQLEPVGASDEALLDLTIADAARTGFEPVVVIVREATASAFLAHFEAHPPALPVRLAIQKRDGRAASAADGSWRPWGTGHAVLSAATHMTGSFCVANADDYYGPEALEALAEWSRSGEGDAALIAYRLDRTLSESGGVSRAVCGVRDGWLTGLAEHVDVRRTADRIVGHAGGERALDAVTPVSMNLWGFRPRVMDLLQSAFGAFRQAHAADPVAEFRLPDVVGQAVADGALRVRVIGSASMWTGLTFASDREQVVERLRRMTNRADDTPQASG